MATYSNLEEAMLVALLQHQGKMMKRMELWNKEREKGLGKAMKFMDEKLKVIP